MFAWSSVKARVYPPFSIKWPQCQIIQNTPSFPTIMPLFSTFVSYFFYSRKKKTHTHRGKKSAGIPSNASCVCVLCVITNRYDTCMVIPICTNRYVPIFFFSLQPPRGDKIRVAILKDKRWTKYGNNFYGIFCGNSITLGALVDNYLKTEMLR